MAQVGDVGGAAEDESMDGVDAAAGTEVEAEGEEATGSEIAAVGGFVGSCT